MNKRQILMLSVILIVLILGVAVTKWQKPAELTTEAYEPLNLSFQPSIVGQIEISKGASGKPVKLVKAGAIWKIPDLWNVRADQEKVYGFLEDIQKAKGERRASDKALFADFGISDEEAFRIKLSDTTGREVLSFLMGVKTPDTHSVFIRKTGSANVFMADVNLFSALGVSADSKTKQPDGNIWVDLKLVLLNADQVAKLNMNRFEKNKEIPTVGLVKEEAADKTASLQWKFVRKDLPFSLEPAKVRAFLGNLADWRAAKVLDPSGKDYGFQEPFWQLKVVLKTGEEISLVCGRTNETSEDYFIRVSQEPVVYQVPKYQFEDKDIDDSQFFTNNPLGIDLLKTEKVTIHTDKKEIQFDPREKKSDAQKFYTDGLKTFEVRRLLLNPSEAKKVSSPAPAWIEIKNQGKDSIFLDFGDAMTGKTNKRVEYAAVKRGNALVFAVDERVYKKIFENIDRLK